MYVRSASYNTNGLLIHPLVILFAPFLTAWSANMITPMYVKSATNSINGLLKHLLVISSAQFLTVRCVNLIQKQSARYVRANFN